MPLALTCDELVAGMRLAEAVRFNGVVMLPGGKALTSSDIGALRRRFSGIIVRVGDPVLDDAVEFQDDSHDRKVADTAQRRVVHCMSEVHGRYASRSSAERANINLTAAKQAVTEIIEYLRSNPVSSALLSRCIESDDRFAVHAGNVFYLSILLATTLRDYVAGERQRQTAAELQRRQLHDLSGLGLGAMFADIGMIPLAGLYRINRPLGQSERQMVLDHPITGAASLPEQFPPAARMVIKAHHESYDGTGYPRQIAGDHLHVFARILRIADAFDAVTSDGTYDEVRSPIRALWEMSAGPYRRFYDPVLMEAFAKLIQPFPIGAKLRLVDGRFAVVVKHNHDAPFDPTIVVAFDSENQRLRGLDAPLSLSDSGLTVKSVAGEDLTYLHFSDGEHAAPPRRFRTLLEAFYP